MFWWNLLNTFLALLALGVGIAAVYFSRRQVKLQEEQAAKEKRTEDETREWAAKCQEAIQLIMTVAPIWLNSGGAGFYRAFSDPELRQRIEAYLVDINPSNPMIVRAKAVTPDQLQLPGVRQTIRDVLDTIKKIRQDPVLAKTLRLAP